MLSTTGLKIQVLYVLDAALKTEGALPASR